MSGTKPATTAAATIHQDDIRLSQIDPVMRKSLEDLAKVTPIVNADINKRDINNAGIIPEIVKQTAKLQKKPSLEQAVAKNYTDGSPIGDTVVDRIEAQFGKDYSVAKETAIVDKISAIVGSTHTRAEIEGLVSSLRYDVAEAKGYNNDVNNNTTNAQIEGHDAELADRKKLSDMIGTAVDATIHLPAVNTPANPNKATGTTVVKKH